MEYTFLEYFQFCFVKFLTRHRPQNGDGRNIDPQSMEYPKLHNTSSYSRILISSCLARPVPVLNVEFHMCQNYLNLC